MVYLGGRAQNKGGGGGVIYFPVGAIPLWSADPGTNKKNHRRLSIQIPAR